MSQTPSDPLPDWATPHTVTVETHLGASAYGDTFESPVEVECWLEADRQLVRNAQGEQVVSEATVTVRPEHQHRFTPDSRVTINAEWTTYVLKSAPRSGLGFWDHCLVTLA